MAVFETWLNQDLQKPLKPQVLDGSLFTQDNAGNLVGVVLFNNGEPEEISGTVGGMILRADGATVAVVDGNSTGNKGWIILPQSAYAVPGQIVIVIKVTNGSTVTTIGAATVCVQKSSTDTIVDPGTIISGIDTLIATIDAAIDSIPADWSSLLTSIAPVFSTNAAYNIGDYVWHTTGADAPAKLYKFTAAHAVGAWDSTQVTAAVLSTDIKNLQHIYTPVNGKPTSNLMPDFGETVTLSQVEQDINGQVSFVDRTLTIPATQATQSAAGLMSAQDKQKLDAVESGNYAVCSTAGSTQTKSVTIPGISQLTDGLTVTIRFANGQDYDGFPKLKINSLAAQDIGYLSGYLVQKGEWSAGAVLTFVYDSSAGKFIIVNGEHATFSSYGKTIMDTSPDGKTDITRALSSTVFYNTYVKNLITGAEVYSASNIYAVGAIVRHNGRMYRCKTAITTPEPWLSAHWDLIPAIQEEIDTQRFDYNEAMRYIITGADPYSATQAYSVGAYCIYGNTLYKCTTAIPSGEAWNSAHWEDQTPLLWQIDSVSGKVDTPIGARNRLLKSYDPDIHPSGSSAYTVTKNQSVGAWNAIDAIRVAGTGGTSNNVFYLGGTSADIAYNSSISVSGQKYSFGVYVKNNHATKYIGIRTSPQGSTSIFWVSPGQALFIKESAVGNGSSVLQIVFRVENIGDDFDVTFWHPQIELGGLVSDWRPAFEDTPSLIPLASSGAQGTNGLMSQSDKAILEDLYYDEAYAVDSIKSSAISGATGFARKIGYTVCVNFNAVLGQQVAGLNEVEIMTLPVGFRPVSDVYFMAVGDYASSVIFFGAVVYAATGKICAKAKTSLASGKSLNGSVTFFLPGEM